MRDSVRQRKQRDCSIVRTYRVRYPVNAQSDLTVLDVLSAQEVHMIKRFIYLCIAIASFSCAEEERGKVTPADQSCVPSRLMYDSVVADYIEQQCGTCHGETPQFGAPQSLTRGYEDLVSGDPGGRLIDRIVARVANKTMPPVGTPPIAHNVQDTLVEWASCGAEHTDHSVGLVVDRPVFTAPEQAPSGLTTLDLTAPDFVVGEKTLDLYQCFVFDVPVEEDRFIRRIEPVVDVSEVLHHVVLLRDLKKKFEVGSKACKGALSNTQYLYAWAPGGGALQFPEGGLRVSPGERYIVQIHYNNGAGLKGVKDNSGVRLLHAKPEGKEFGMFAPGPAAFAIPANSTFAATGTCKVSKKLELLAGMPHMHSFGTAFNQRVIRADGSKETVIDLTGWSFEMQPFYHLPMTVGPGDLIETTCTWHNNTEKTVTTGEKTGDEMCFNFMYTSPPTKKAYCNDFIISPNTDVDYKVGKCAPEDADPTPPKGTHPPELESMDPLTGGDLGKHSWELSYSTLVIGPVGNVFLADDPGLFIAKGQAWTDGDQLTIDAAVRLILKTKQGVSIDSTDFLSASGTVVKGDKEGQGEWKISCGDIKSQPIRWQVSGDELWVTVDKTLVSYTLPGLYVFKRRD